MSDADPKEPNARQYLIYIVGRLDELHAKVDRAVLERKAADRHVHMWHILGHAITYSGRLGAQLSAVFVAGYVAVEHSWYVERIREWVSHLLSMRF